jgi:hypothetical protein
MSPRPLLDITIPGLRLVSEANSHTHWRSRQQRARMQRETARAHVLSKVMGARPQSWSTAWSLDAATPLRVTITRIAPRRLDSDNAVGSAKAVRDGIADAFRVDDNDPRIEWVVCQSAGGAKEYAVNIRIEAV